MLGYGGDYTLTVINLNLRSLGPKSYLHSITVFQNVHFWYCRAWRAVSPSIASKNTHNNSLPASRKSTELVTATMGDPPPPKPKATPSTIPSAMDTVSQPWPWSTDRHQPRSPETSLLVGRVPAGGCWYSSSARCSSATGGAASLPRTRTGISLYVAGHYAATGATCAHGQSAHAPISL